MRYANPTLPPRYLLQALRQPRRPQLHDQQVRDIFRRWKLRGEPIEYADLHEVAAIVAPGDELDAPARRRIIAAVERAGIRIHNYDSLRARSPRPAANPPARSQFVDRLMPQFTAEGFDEILSGRLSEPSAEHLAAMVQKG
jgi:hypothetical protein